MNTATASYPFEIVKNGTDRIFTYKKAKLGYKTFIPMLWPAFIAGVFLAYRKVAASHNFQTPAEKFSMGIFYALFYTIILAVLAVVVLNLLRRGGSFTLNSQGVLLNNTLYPYQDIHSLYIKSPRGQVTQTLAGSKTGFIVVSNDRVQTIGLGTAAVLGHTADTVVGAATQLSGAAGKGIANSIRQRSYKICFLFGKSEKVLASQITENDALQLLRAINS